MRKIILLMVFIVNVNWINACDFCNCYLGLNPHYKKNSVGLRYHYMSSMGTNFSDAELESMQRSRNDFWETRTDIELHGQYYPTQKLQLLFSMPYVINKEGVNNNTDNLQGNRTMHGTPTPNSVYNFNTETVNGIGDPVVIANYQLFNKTAMDTLKFSHRLFAGGGIKIPLGKYKIEEGENPHERNHQPGTGSWDVLANLSYLGKINKMGFNINLSYLLATTNKQQFQFGNRLNVNSVVYYQLKCKKTLFYPNIGAYLEQAGLDQDIDGDYLNNTGGTVVYAHAGLDFYYKKISINTAFQLPVSQSLNQPQAEVQYRIISGITFVLN